MKTEGPDPVTTGSGWRRWRGSNGPVFVAVLIKRKRTQPSLGEIGHEAADVRSAVCSLGRGTSKTVARSLGRDDPRW
jgi:hypothetical protein